MAIVAKIALWLFRFLSVASVFGALWGVSVYTGIGGKIAFYFSYSWRVFPTLLQASNRICASANNLISQVLQAVQGNEYFDFFVYILSLDVMSDNLSYLLEGFIHLIIFGMGSILVVLVEGVAIYLMFRVARSVVKAMASGFTAGTGS